MNQITKLFTLTILSAFVLIVVASSVHAAKGEKLWRQIDENRVPARGARNAVPEKYLVFRLEENSMKSALADLPLENTDAARGKSVVMEIPMPDGSLQRFRMEETQVLAAHLAVDFPDWKTFVGYGVDDPTAVGRFDWNALGFHGYAATSKGVVVVDPYQTGDRENYQVFYKHDFGKSDMDFSCRTGTQVEPIIEMNPQFKLMLDAERFSFGAQIRTYRLAVATTGEWSRNAAGFAANPELTPIQIRTNALAVIVTAVNRLNGIFERELASRFQLVNPSVTNEDTNIVYDNPATDPYNNTDNPAQLIVNQNNITAEVGTANFDIGHLFGTNGGGVANKSSLCVNDDKAEGYSARGTNTGDPFVVDYVAHELGHQFGADHTYNNLDSGNNNSACSTREATEAYEPASGSTIMSYVGICNNGRDLQQFVDPGLPTFHIISQTVINRNLTTGPPQTTACGVASGSNSVPTVNAGAAYTIPRLTPFTLTAAGADADAGDAGNLLYSWEQYNVAPSASGPLGTPPNTYDIDDDGVPRPLLRAYSPVASPSRTFPSLPFVLNPQNNETPGGNQPVLTYTGTHPSGAPGAVCEPGETCVVGERLPTINRTLTFRVAVRDRRGGVSDAETNLNVAAAAGPFRVTAQDTATTWAGNSAQTITWDVAGTTGNGINAGSVNITLSTDGGQTFPITLSSNTANDGSETITIPNVATTTARIRIQPTNNVFFDINNVNFTITAAANVPSRAMFDFDGDGRTDIAVFRPSTGDWFLNRSSQGMTAVRFGAATDLIAPADYDGDGRTDIAVFRPSNGTWYRINSQTGTFAAVQFGQAGDLPRPADFDGDGRADINVFRPSNGFWYRLNSTNGQFVFNRFGQDGDVPVANDYDGDGRANLAVFRPSENRWYIAPASGILTNFTVINFGATSDIPVPANYDGDNRTVIAVFRPSTGVWVRLNSTNNQSVGTQFGQNGDVPVAGDYDGDGRADLAVFRPANGVWYVSNSQSGSLSVQFGTGSDRPVPAAYIGQ